MNKVNFLVVGSQKCGTTTLYKHLCEHPKISGCVEKEPSFWTYEGEGWREKIESYHRLFPDIDDSETLSFEASTHYTKFPFAGLETWEKVFEYNPNMKILYVVRDPFKRAFSAYLHNVEMGYDDNENVNNALIRDARYINISRYWMQISPWVERFGKANVCLVDFDEMTENSQMVLAHIFNFLGVEEFMLPYPKMRMNSTSDDRKVSKSFTKYSRFAGAFKAKAPKWIAALARPIWRVVAYRKARVLIGRSTRVSPDVEKAFRRMVWEDLRMLGEIFNKNFDKWR